MPCHDRSDDSESCPEYPDILRIHIFYPVFWYSGSYSLSEQGNRNFQGHGCSDRFLQNTVGELLLRPFLQRTRRNRDLLRHTNERNQE